MLTNYLFYSIDYKIAFIGLLLIIVLLIFLHLLFTKFRIAKGAKKRSNVIEKKYSINSPKTIKLINILKNSKKYNKKNSGSYKSFSLGERKKIKKFLIDWMMIVPIYIELISKNKDNKYKTIHILVSNDPTLSRFNDDWIYKGYSNGNKKNAKKNYKSLVKFMNKNKAARSIIYCLLNIYSSINNSKNSDFDFDLSENHKYISYAIDSSNKKIKKISN